MEIRQLMEALPQFAQHFLGTDTMIEKFPSSDFILNSIRYLGMTCNMLLRYSETCQAAYRGLVQPDSEDKRVISATWAKDEDIHRFLRFFLSHSVMNDHAHKKKRKKSGLFRVGRLCKLYEHIGTPERPIVKLMKIAQRKSGKEVPKKRKY